MSFIKIKQAGDTLEVVIYGPFNYYTIQLIEAQLTEDVDSLSLILEECTLLDSEAVIFLYNWQKSGKSLSMKDPPDILFEILDILELSDALKNINISTKS